MQSSHPPEVQVVIPAAQSNGDSQRLPRPLSVDEALRFSPMTSAPVFALESIMRPDVGHPSFSNWSPTYDTRAAGKMIDRLDNETQAGAGNVAHLTYAQESLQQLLKGDDLTEYNFNLPSRIRNSQHFASQKQQPNDLTSHHLGPFAKLILDTTDVSYRYPSATTPSPRKRDSALKPLPTPISQRKPAQLTKRESSVQDQSVASSQERKDVPRPVVIIPSLPSSAKMDEYKPVPEPSSTKKRKRNSQGDDDRFEDLRMKDQKEVADAALTKLQDLLQEVFEAEDQLHPDSSSEGIRPNTKFFSDLGFIEDLRPVLSSEIHASLQKVLRSVRSFDRLRDIPTEYVKRLQKLCETPILSAHSLELSIESASSDHDTETWVRNLGSMYNCLLSVGTFLQTMSGNLSTKDLCPEDIIQAIPVTLNHVFDNCIVPAVECRSNGKNSALFGVFSSHKQVLGSLVHQTRKILGLLAGFISSVDLAEDTVTAIEFLIVKLIFVENAHNDKESTLGFQKYEAVRRGAMDVLAKIFAKYPDQRAFILDEILVSLEKLPSTKQSARQFKTIDGKHIQLLSALVIQLVQTTALQKPPSAHKSKRALPTSRKAVEEDSQSGEDDEDPGSDDNGRGSPLDRLSRVIEPLFDNAVRSATYITRYIVQRAMTSTKTGDQPYRNLLDLFTEDLVSVLGSPDWPGAELLLRVLASQMVGIADHDKSPANAKNMALELLGWMASAISELASTTQHLSNAADESDPELTEYLRQLYDDHANRTLHVEDLIIRDGPYRVALEYLEEKGVGGSNLSSASGYLLAQWGKTVCSVYLDPEENKSANDNPNVYELAKTMDNIYENPRWLQVNSEFARISTQQANVACLLTVLNNGFCKAFDTIVKVLLGSITSEQAKVRSRSLKSVIQMLERDPSLLDRDNSIMPLIFRCATDSSPMVRDSALTLIAKLIIMKPTLEEDCCRAILACSSDQTLGVRKRCIGLMKDIYIQTTRQDLRLSVTEHLLQRMTDHEESLVTLARQVLEEMWFAPFHQSIDSIQNSPHVKVSLEELATLIVDCVRKSSNVASTLELFLKLLLRNNEKAASLNTTVCKAIVATMFERVVHNTDSDDKHTLPALLQSITVFAKAKATLFTPDQLETLHPYIGHLSSTDDLLLFRSVVVIYRCVLPNISTSHNTLLRDVQNDLFKSVAKLARTELNEVMACLWTINGVLQNTERLVRLAISVLKGIKQATSVKLDGSANADVLGRVRSYIRIAGCVGKHCDLEKSQASFSQAFPDSKVNSVAGLIVDFVAPYAQPTYPREVRLMALESLGSVCQSWPAQYGREQAQVALSSVFDEDQKDLQNIVLKAFLEFFSIHEGKSEKLIETGDGASDEGAGRLGGSLRASDNDGAAALIAQNFLKHMLHAAVSGQDSYAQTAIELIASINRQGLIHPKECAGALVALETSTNPMIAKTAFETHKMLHQQHESMFDREYMRAVQDAFYYQRDVVGDPTGAFLRPFSAKLAPLFEIIKTSSSKYQKKFLTNLCSKVDFDIKKLGTSGSPPEHLLFARFVSQNLAFFEYGQIAELIATITSLERVVGATGTVLAHAIETEIFPAKIETAAGDQANLGIPAATTEITPPQCDPKALKQLSVSAAILLMLWETRSYLRRLYGINSQSRQKEGKTNQKEVNKAPSKVPGVSGDRYCEIIARAMDSFGSTEAMTNICKQFATLLSIDDELKVAADDDHDSTHSPGEMEDVGAVLSAANPANGSKPGKRRSSISGGGTPKKAKKARTSNAKKRQSVEAEDGGVVG